MPITTVQGLLSRISNQFDKNSIIYLDNATTRTTTWNASSQNVSAPRLAYVETVPSPLETGVTAYIPTEINISTSSSMPAMFCELIDMGNINLGTNTFTDGAAAPTRTYLGTSRQLPVSVWIECTTATNVSPGNMTITYVDQDNNTAETTSALAVTGSATRGSGSFATLNGNDWGVLDITAAAQSGGTTPSGVLKFWGVIPIAYVLPGASLSFESITEIFPDCGNFVRLAANSQLAVISVGTTTAASTFGNIRYVGDN